MASNKVWLNDRADEHGSITWTVEERVRWKDSKKVGVKKGCQNCTLRLTDCYEAINLDFSYSDREGYKERYNKLSTLITELYKLKREFVDTYTEPDPEEIEEDEENAAKDLERLLVEVG